MQRKKRIAEGVVLTVASGIEYLALATGCSSGTGGHDDAGSSGCTPQCGSRVCGKDPVCGQSCGSCNDENPCTTDTCTEAGACEYKEIEDYGFAGCEGFNRLEYCLGGQVQTLSCAELCDQGGNNLVEGCLPSTGKCSCGKSDMPCIVGNSFCSSDPGVLVRVECVGDLLPGGKGIWVVTKCTDYCTGAGYAKATGQCSQNGQNSATCLCCSPNCSGKECGDDGCGGTCGSCPTGYACSFGSCNKVNMCGGEVCPKSCCSPSGAVCCKPPFCSGDCSGSSCCH